MWIAPHVFVGVDGGGTKTAVAVVDHDGSICSEARGGPSAYRSIGLDTAAGEIARLIVEAIGGRPVGRVLAAVSDVDTRDDQSRVQAAIERALTERIGDGLPAIDVANDAIAALASGGEELGRGITCIAGTGSVAFGLDGRGNEARAGGWGPPFGDGGSGYWIGFQAIARALHHFDRGERDSLLIRALLAASSCQSLPALLFGYAGASEESASASVYRGRVAALAPAVEAAALDGDSDAIDVFRGAGLELARLIDHVAHRLEIGTSAIDIILAGGLWSTRVTALQLAVRASLARTVPGARLGKPTRSPAVGAALLARVTHQRGYPAPAGLIPD